MSKTIKITKSQINNLINEEVARFKKIKSLENRKNEILSQLNEMYELEELTELGIEEGLGDTIKAGMQKVTNAFTKANVLNGQYLAASKNKANVMKYGPALAKLKALGLNDVQAQEATAMMLDNNQMASFVNGHITPVFDPKTSTIKFSSTAAISNPNPNAPE